MFLKTKLTLVVAAALTLTALLAQCVRAQEQPDNAVKPSKTVGSCLAVFALRGKEGKIAMSYLVYAGTKDDKQGWLVVPNNGHTLANGATRTYFGNQSEFAQAAMKALPEAVIHIAIRVPLAATEQSISESDLLTYVKPCELELKRNI